MILIKKMGIVDDSVFLKYIVIVCVWHSEVLLKILNQSKMNILLKTVMINTTYHILFITSVWHEL